MDKCKNLHFKYFEMSEILYDMSRKGLTKGLNASSIDKAGKPINYTVSKRECNTET